MEHLNINIDILLRIDRNCAVCYVYIPPYAQRMRMCVSSDIIPVVFHYSIQHSILLCHFIWIRYCCVQHLAGDIVHVISSESSFSVFAVETALLKLDIKFNIFVQYHAIRLYCSRSAISNELEQTAGVGSSSKSGVFFFPYTRSARCERPVGKATKHEQQPRQLQQINDNNERATLSNIKQ